MQNDTHPDPERPVLDELDGTLRRAVEAVRRSPVPVEARDRALDRARRIGAQLRFPGPRRQAFIALVAGIAAVLLLSVAVWPERFLPNALRPERQRIVAFDEHPQVPDDGEKSTIEGFRRTAPTDDTAKDKNEKKTEQGRGESRLRNESEPDARPQAIREGMKDAPSGPGSGNKPARGGMPSQIQGGFGGGSGANKGSGNGGFGGGNLGMGGGMLGFGGGSGGQGMPGGAGMPGGPGMPGMPGMPGGPGMPPQTPAAGLKRPGGGPNMRYAMPATKDAAPATPKPTNPAASPAPPGEMPRSRAEGGRRALSTAPAPASGEMKPATDWRPPADRGDADVKKSLEQLRIHRLRERSMAPTDKKALDQLGGQRGDRGEEKGEGKGQGQEAKGAEKQSEKAKKKGDDGKPQVWHAEGQRPTFARVYVGDGVALDLVSLRVSVTIDGPRARTVVDHVFHNPHPRRLEGTFEYPLPAGASPSYFAMFAGQGQGAAPPLFASRKGGSTPLSPEALDRLAPAALAREVSGGAWGTLHEARVVSRQKALETYEDIVRTNIDPALLEYAGGNTFSGRVFPIPPQGYNRVIIAYEELLPVVQGQARYTFPLPNGKVPDVQFSLQANAADCPEAVFEPKDAERRAGGGQLVYRRRWHDAKTEEAVKFSFRLPDAEFQATSGRRGDNGPRYLYARIRPELKVTDARPYADHAVFLLDTSQSEYPGRFAANMKLLRKILESDPDIKRFNILTFNVATAWVEKDWLPNTPAGRKQAFARLDGLVLEGATDMSVALDALCKVHGLADGSPLDVFVLSDGQITWGEPDVVSLVGRFEAQCPYRTHFQCYRTGLGAPNVELFQALTRRGGGIYDWFADASLPDVARAHRRQCFQVERVRFIGGPAASDVLVANRQAAVYPDGEMIVSARFANTGRTTLLLEGTFLGQKTIKEYPVEVKDRGELAPRAWAEIAVASLLALNDPRLDSLITAYCQEFGIGSRVASFLVLENDNDYKRLQLEEERGKTVRGDLGQYLEELWQALGKPLPPKEAFVHFLTQANARIQVLQGPQSGQVQKLLPLLSDKDFELPRSDLKGTLLHRADVPPTYLDERDRDPRVVDTYLKEAKRRVDRDDVAGAVRVLSSVIEEYPERSDALRLVGYRLLDLKQPAQAAHLFRQVERSRPFEPHSYRDLALSLEESGKYGLAALHYEILLAGTWHNRFRSSLKEVAEEEYQHMLHEAIAHRTGVSRELLDFFGERLEWMKKRRQPSDLRVTISWNTDATDVDLWVIEPDGTKCFYQHNRTKNGGMLSEDQTQGYGPERYQIAKAPKGKFTIKCHYYRANQNLVAGETSVNVVVTRNAGTPQETTQRYTIILKRQGEEVTVCEVEF